MPRNVQLEHLVLAPFRETAGKARTALDNAESAEEHDGDVARAMQRAARGLLSKAERALKKIEPLCERFTGEYGPAFVDAVKDNGDIAKHRKQLNDLLWDFDDYMEVDSYDEEMYNELAAQLRAAALKIADVLVTMKVERPPASAALPAIEEETGKPETPEPAMVREQIDGHTAAETSVGPTERLETTAEANAQLKELVASKVEQPIETIRPEDIPREPGANPWETTEPAPDLETAEESERRPPIQERGDLDLVSPLTTDNNAFGLMFSRRDRSDSQAPPQSPSIRSRSSFHSTTEQTVTRHSQGSFGTPIASRPASGQPFAQGSAGSPAASRLSLTPVTSHSSNCRPGSLSSQQPGLEVVHSPNGDDGPIPIMPESTEPDSASEAPQGLNCNIDRYSSFAHFGKFCQGAREALRTGEFGVRKNNKKGTAVAKCNYCYYEVDARLLDADDNRLEFNYPSSSISIRARFLAKSHLPSRQPSDRIYGCHFCIFAGKTPRPSDATVFFSQTELCAHMARHPRPLPQIPALKVVVGTDGVPEDNNNNNNRHHDYDVRFTRPHPIPSAVPDEYLMPSANLPSAVAAESFRMTVYGLRTPPDRAEVLQFVVGQKIVGIEFPPQYEGQWAAGWADDERGVFPLEYVRLVPPATHREGDGGMRVSWSSGSGSGSGGGTGGGGDMSAVTRWKFNPSTMEKGKGGGGDGEKWLKFGKGEVITGISFPYEEHWCWSGRNAKGKRGIFPRAFIRPKSLRGPSEEGSTIDEPGGKSSSVWSWRPKKGRGTPTSPVEELTLGRRPSRASYY